MSRTRWAFYGRSTSLTYSGSLALALARPRQPETHHGPQSRGLVGLHISGAPRVLPRVSVLHYRRSAPRHGVAPRVRLLGP